MVAVPVQWLLFETIFVAPLCGGCASDGAAPGDGRTRPALLQNRKLLALSPQFRTALFVPGTKDTALLCGFARGQSVCFPGWRVGQMTHELSLFRGAISDCAMIVFSFFFSVFFTYRRWSNWRKLVLCDCKVA